MFNFSVNVFKLQNPTSKLVAFASITIEDVVVLDGFKIFDGAKGLFMASPSREGKDRDGNKAWYDQVKFLTFDDSPNKEGAEKLKREIEDAVLAAYRAKGGGSTQTTQADAANAQTQRPRNKIPW
jgi:DNA-binding cell septation regulator SpoVG